MKCWIKTGEEVVAIRLPNWLGDAVMASGLVTLLKERWPSLRLILLGPEPILRLFQGDRRISGFALTSSKPQEVTPIDPRRVKRASRLAMKLQKIGRRLPFFLAPPPLEIRSAQGALLPLKVDLCIRLTHSFSSTWQLLYRLRAPLIGTGFFAHHTRQCEGRRAMKRGKKSAQEAQGAKARHQVELYTQLLAPIWEGEEIRPSSPKLFLQQQHLACARKWLEEECFLEADLEGDKESRPPLLIGFNTQAAYGPAKCWPEEHFIALAKRLLTHKRVRLIFFGDQRGAPHVNALVEKLRAHFVGPERIIDASGKTSMEQFMGLLYLCDLLITNDSGPMHLRAALARDQGLVALFGSTDPDATGPYHCGEVLYEKASCSPCFLRECPIDFRCMKALGVERAYRACLRQLPDLVS